MTAEPGGSALARPSALTPFLAALVLVVVPSVVVGALVAGLALLAGQRWEAEFGGDVGRGDSASVGGHVLVLLLLFWLLVATARSLWGPGGGRVLAIVVSLVVGFGPMSLAAVPISAAVYSADQTMAPWWPAGLALVWMVLVIATALWTLRWFPVSDTGSWLERRRWLVAAVAVVATYAVTSIVADFWLDPGHSDLNAQMQVGWILLATGMLTGAATTSSLGARIAMVLLSPAVIAMMFFAYNRMGGWPGVPGWEGGQPPLYSTIGVGVLICTAPLLGWVVGLVGHAAGAVGRGRAPRVGGSVAHTA
jgi:hypothetical protein